MVGLQVGRLLDYYVSNQWRGLYVLIWVSGQCTIWSTKDDQTASGLKYLALQTILKIGQNHRGEDNRNTFSSQLKKKPLHFWQVTCSFACTGYKTFIFSPVRQISKSEVDATKVS